MTNARRVVLNALFLDPRASGGPDTYLRGLAPALREARPESDLTVVTTRRGASALRAAGWANQGFSVRDLPCDEGERVRRQLAEQVLLPRLAQTLKADLLHSLASVAPIFVRNVAHVITVHDVNFIHHSTFNPITTWGMRQIVPRAARRADRLIADTAVARDDISATLGLPAERFTVVHLGVETQDRVHPSSEREMRTRFQLGEDRVVLCVGAKRPHKNQGLLVRALPYLPDDLRVVLVGHPEPYEAELRRLAHQLGVEDRLVLADWLDDATLEGLWTIASVAALPTLAEGFCLPLLEAMAHGVPVAASELPVLREVGGSWPVYFDPQDAHDAARAIRVCVDHPPDPAVACSRAAGFAWSAAAEATWEVYDRAVARHRGVASGQRGPAVVTHR